MILSGLVIVITSIPVSSEARYLHMPIVIEGDSGFLPSNGVRGGSGNENDPYVISGWQIELSSGVGISITNTTACFIISDVQVNGTASQWADTSGVYVHNSMNWRIKDSVFNDTTYGLVLDECTDASVEHSQFRSISIACVRNTRGLDVNIVDNDFLGGSPVWAQVWTNSVVLGNNVQSADVGVYIDQGINVTIEGNVFNESDNGVSLEACFSIYILSNDFLNCTGSVWISYTDFVYLRGNSMVDSRTYGIEVVYQSYMVMPEYNRFVRSTLGAMTVNDSHDMRVHDNLFENNTGVAGVTAGGVTLTDSTYSIWIDKNDFVGNTPEQAIDGSDSNYWNNEYPLGGNWWSDYAGVDLFSGAGQNESGPDGFGDSPYVIDSDSQDSYPFMAILDLDMPPEASFIVDPLVGDLTTSFALDGSSSSDSDTGDSIQEYRWDFDGDGSWDTPWSIDPNATHVYPVPGNYTVILEVIDSSGVVDIAMQRIFVSGELIPEFSMIILPVIGMIAVGIVLLSRRSE